MMEPQKKATILLVDDEAALTRLMQTYLGKLGYTVESALNATEASEIFQRDPARFQLLVADLTLPDLPGQDMALRMVEHNPDLRVLLCSGYPFAVDSLPESAQHRFAALQKPFLPNMLAKAIEDLLQRKIE
jgi:DNA-binding NtrC family response regulator